MKQNLYSVLDIKAGIYGLQFFKNNHDEALRYFGDGCREPKTMLYIHPEDFTLHFHGVFDNESGLIEPVNPIQYLARATDYKKYSPKAVQDTAEIGGIQ